MELGLGDPSGIPRLSNLLSLQHLLLDSHIHARQMSVGRDPSLRMFDQDQVAKAGHLISSIDHLTGRGGPDRGAADGPDVDPVIPLAGALRPEVRKDLTAQGPQEATLAEGRDLGVCERRSGGGRWRREPTGWRPTRHRRRRRRGGRRDNTRGRS